MRVVNLLEFLNNTLDLYALDYARCDNRDLVNFLNLMTADEQFTHSIDLGLIFLEQRNTGKYIIVDGLSRILSLCLLLHAVCECYKKTTERNEKAIKTIRKKYLYTSSTKIKLHLSKNDADLYVKIINGERLSGHEKQKPMFLLLHNFWTQIKEDNLRAADIFKMLQKINVTLVETEGVSNRNLYYKLNSGSRKLNQLALIDDYMAENKVLPAWEEIKESYKVNKNDLTRFLKDFFITKFNFKQYDEERLYENFVNYFETMKQYIKPAIVMKNIKRASELYYNILNLDINNEEIKKALINIKRHDGEDTYAYILNVYDDFYSNSISESIFIEILNTIDEYLKNRQSSGKNIDFNELIQYLNAFITFK